MNLVKIYEMNYLLKNIRKINLQSKNHGQIHHYLLLKK